MVGWIELFCLMVSFSIAYCYLGGTGVAWIAFVTGIAGLVVELVR